MSNLTREEALNFLREYRQAVRSNISSSSPLTALFSKILINETMYNELTFGLDVPKGHVALFEGIPLQSCEDLPYGAVLYLPKFLTVEVSKIPPKVVH